MFKTSMIALAAVAMLATGASAQVDTMNFAQPQMQESATTVNLGAANIPANASVQVHEYNGATQGILLADVAVAEGAHSGLKIPLSHRSSGELLVTLTVDGQTVGRQLVKSEG
tara:strand:+ start:87 stop:425 length:339 start_codon:yes stop_codon:yes gene_type:complete